MAKDLFHITIWLFFFITGGILGSFLGMFFIFSFALILWILALIVRAFFLEKIEVNIWNKKKKSV